MSCRMKLVHIADLHCGYRRYQRTTPLGQNQREADVAQTFARVIDQVIAIAPDVLVIAGDVFDKPHPANSATLAAFQGFARLRRALPDMVAVMIAGNHDVSTIRSEECALQLFATLGFHVVDRAPERLTFPSLGLSVLAVPEAPRVELPAFTPDPVARYNVLLFHGEIAGVIPGGTTERTTTVAVAPSELGAERWDYIALGHHHTHHAVARNAYYAGSMDYTSTNVWGDLQAEAKAGLPGKSFIEWDLVSGIMTRHDIPTGRVHLDLTPVGAHGMAAAEIDAALVATVEAAPIDNAVVRCRVLDIDPLESRALNQKQLRKWKTRALNFQLDERKVPRPKAPTMDQIVESLRRRPLIDIVRERMDTQELPDDVDRATFKALGLQYFDQASDGYDDADPQNDPSHTPTLQEVAP